MTDKPRFRRVHPRKVQIQKKLSLAQRRRESRIVLYGTLWLRHGGIVPCFVCGEHVSRKDATLEHVVPLSKGGADKMSNYAISHSACNNEKGDRLIVHAAALQGAIHDH